MYRRQIMAGLAAVSLGVVAGCASGGTAGTTANGEGAAVTVYPAGQRPAGPRIQGRLLDGSAFRPSTLKGKVAVINFWASDCAPCRAEAADLAAVRAASRVQNVEFLGVNVRDSKDAATAFARSKLNYPSLFDPAGKVGLQFKGLAVTFIPATVVLDRHGDVAAVFHAALLRSDLQPVVSRLAAETI